MIDAFSQFSLPQISTVARRTSLAALAIGGIAVIGLGLTGHALVGIGVCLGLALALGNFRLISRATIKASMSGNPDTRRPLALNTLGRMGVITVIAFGLVFLSRPLGFGTLVGLAAFQFTLLSNVVVAMLHEQGQAVVPAGGATEIDS
jgi:uncharacterized protein YneF (UPF0154 family)